MLSKAMPGKPIAVLVLLVLVAIGSCLQQSGRKTPVTAMATVAAQDDASKENIAAKR